MSEDGLALEQFTDPTTSKVHKYVGAVPTLTQQGPQLMGAEFEGDAKIEDVFVEYSKMLEEAKTEIQVQMKKIQASKNAPKLVIPG